MFVPYKLSNYASSSQTFNKYSSCSETGTLPRREAPHYRRLVLGVVERYIKEKDTEKLLDNFRKAEYAEGSFRK